MRFLIAIMFVLLTNSAYAQNITGAGATFPYPLYSKWIEEYHRKTGIAINYQSIGSGGGINQVKARTVSFGATDVPLSPKELTDNKLTQFPTVMGAVVPVVNLPGIQTVSLTDQQLVMIYNGEIKKWNDPRLAPASPTKLPDLAITVVYRADASGTSYIWTSYLSKVSSTWKANVGAATSVEWPTGIAAKGNEGVAGSVRQQLGSIGYVEWAYAKQTSMNVIRLNGKTAGATTFRNRDWPIIAPTYILVPNESKDRKGVLEFFEWAKRNGNEIAIQLDYIPL